MLCGFRVPPAITSQTFAFAPTCGMTCCQAAPAQFQQPRNASNLELAASYSHAFSRLCVSPAWHCAGGEEDGRKAADPLGAGGGCGAVEPPHRGPRAGHPPHRAGAALTSWHPAPNISGRGYQEQSHIWLCIRIFCFHRLQGACRALVFCGKAN